MRLEQVDPNETCLEAYCRPQPQLDFGQAVAQHVHAMMDVSDGLLIDAQRMAAASGCELGVMLETIPLSAALLAVRSEEHTSELQSLMRISYAVFCLKKKKKTSDKNSKHELECCKES